MDLDEKGLKAAEAVAHWYIGDRYWARKIIGAYLDPDKALADLALEKGDFRAAVIRGGAGEV